MHKLSPDYSNEPNGMNVMRLVWAEFVCVILRIEKKLLGTKIKSFWHFLS